MPSHDYKTRPDWLKARPTFIGASDTAGILGHGYAGQSAYAAYAEKTGGDAVELDSAILRNGQRFQGPIQDLAARHLELNLTAANAFEVHRMEGAEHIGATLDAWETDGDEKYPAEIKSVGKWARGDWSDGGMPLKFYIQCTQQMMCTGTNKCRLVGLTGDENQRIDLLATWYETGSTKGIDGEGILESRLIDRDQEMVEIIERTLGEFWQLVLTKTPPEIDGSEATRELLARLHPDDNGETVQLDEAFDEKFEQAVALKATIKDAKEKLATIENNLRGRIGDATFAELPSGRRVSWKTQERKEFVCKASKFRVLRLMDLK